MICQKEKNGSIKPIELLVNEKENKRQIWEYVWKEYLPGSYAQKVNAA